MTIEEKLKDLILSKHRSVLEFTQSIDMPYATMASIFKRGIHNSSVTNIIKICKALGISADELAEDRIVSIEQTNQSRSHQTEIDDLVNYARRNIDSYADLTVNGQPLSASDIDLLLDAIELSVELIKRKKNRERMASL